MTNHQTQYRIWAEWTDRSEFLVVETATTAGDAITKAVRKGLVSGLGYRRSYLGIRAVPVDPS